MSLAPSAINDDVMNNVAGRFVIIYLGIRNAYFLCVADSAYTLRGGEGEKELHIYI